MGIVAFTGNRPNKPWWGYNNPSMNSRIAEALAKTIIKLIPEITISGMALGVDQIAAEVCIELGIPFIAAIPFKGQESLWPEPSKEKWRYLISKAERVEIISEGPYSAYKLQLRNIWMVDNCDVLLAVFDGSTGGTKNCIDYAKSINKEIIIINPLEFN